MFTIDDSGSMALSIRCRITSSGRRHVTSPPACHDTVPRPSTARRIDWRLLVPWAATVRRPARSPSPPIREQRAQPASITTRRSTTSRASAPTAPTFPAKAAIRRLLRDRGPPSTSTASPAIPDANSGGDDQSRDRLSRRGVLLRTAAPTCRGPGDGADRWLGLPATTASPTGARRLLPSQRELSLRLSRSDSAGPTPAVAAGYNYPNIGSTVATGARHRPCDWRTTSTCVFQYPGCGHRQSVLLHDLRRSSSARPTTPTAGAPAPAATRWSPTNTLRALRRRQASTRRRSRASTSCPFAGDQRRAAAPTRRRWPTSPSGTPSTAPGSSR